jgi:hypothetical protein
MCFCESTGSGMYRVAIVINSEKSKTCSEVSSTELVQASMGSKPIRIKFLIESQTIGSTSSGDQTQQIYN